MPVLVIYGPVLNGAVMARVSYLIPGAVGLAALALVAAVEAPSLAQAQPGLWEIIGAPGAKGPIRQCIPSMGVLARFEHRSKNCTAKLTREHGNVTLVEYVCGPSGFGRSEIEVLTPRSLKISTQGISDGLPFNYVLQAHRVDDCQKSAP